MRSVDINLPIIISILALLFSGISAAISYQVYRERHLPPEIFVTMSQFYIEEDPFIVGADLTFSVANRSNQNLNVLSCSILTDGLHTGAGRFGERASICDFSGDQFSPAEPLLLGPGETRFFHLQHVQDVSGYDPVFTLGLMGIDLNMISDRLKEERCYLQFSWPRAAAGSGWSQNCPITYGGQSFAESSGNQVFTLVIQTGSAESVRVPILLSPNQVWPWDINLRH